MRKFIAWIAFFLALSAILFFEKEIIFGTVLYSRAFVAGLTQSQQLEVLPDVFVSLEAPSPEVLPNKDVAPIIMPEVVVDEKQDKIDDLLEKIDALKRQLADLEVPIIEELTNQVAPKPVDLGIVPIIPLAPVIIETLYQKLLISEVQIAGSGGEKHEYVELYNPHFTEIDLTGWYLQRETKTALSFSTYVSATLFVGKKIAPYGYFLIARRDSAVSPLADIIIDHPLTEDNTLILKNPSGEISDKVGWGIAEDKEGLPAPSPWFGQSIGRSKDEQDSDNNNADFVANILSPRAQNVAYLGADPGLGVVGGGGSGGNGGSPVVVLLQKLVINQVQAEGRTVKDEFVKLYNPNDVEVNLAGFSLKKKTSSGSESNLVSSVAFTGKVVAMGYFLIVPQQNDDGTENYTGSLVPDLRYSGTSFSIADTNTVLLYDAEGVLMSEFLVLPQTEPEPELELPAEPELPPIEPSEPVAPVVIINEIAWMGTEVSSNNEWLELFNPGDFDVDLAGWTLKAIDGTPEINLSGIISARGFYLLERTDDTTVPDFTADQIYTGALGNDGEHLQLKNAVGELINEVDSSAGWFAGDNETKQTMQRVDTAIWQASPEPGGTPGS